MDAPFPAGPDVITESARQYQPFAAPILVTVVADVDWLPCVWMQEGIEEAMVPSGTTAYQEQEADVLRLNGDPVTLNGAPIWVAI